jgi:hypothetical protein
VTGHTEVVGFGDRPKADFWISQGTPNTPTGHGAFRVPTRRLVDTFYAAAMAAGGCDNGLPGLRPHYHPHRYGAFVRDPEGHNSEVVCHEAE